MQYKQKHVLATTQRKHMHTQRKLAPKIKWRLRRARQRRRKLSFVHLAQQNTNTRRARRQDLLPRNAIPLGEDGAQALVPLNNVTKRSF
jgi:hypothetical protein